MDMYRDMYSDMYCICRRRVGVGFGRRELATGRFWSLKARYDGAHDAIHGDMYKDRCIENMWRGDMPTCTPDN